MSRWLITRPAADAAETAKAVEALGHEAVVTPLIDIDMGEAGSIDLAGVQAILFTSANGVRAFEPRSDNRDLPAFAVGDASARTARAAGFERVFSASGAVDDLARLVADRLAPDDGALLHVAGSHVAGDLGGVLAGAGFDVKRVCVYRSRPAAALPPEAVDALAGDHLTGALFFSPRTAGVFARLVDEAGLTGRLGRLVALCLSPAVARRLSGAGWKACRTAIHPTLPDMLALLDGSEPRPKPCAPTRSATDSR